MAECPKCHKQFDEVHHAHANKLEPFLSVDVMEGIDAWGTIFQEKEIICHHGNWVHFRFLQDGKEQLVEMIKFDIEALTNKHRGHYENPKPCEHEGCTNPEGFPAYMHWVDEEPQSYYCLEHIWQEGFCKDCGCFSAGTEAFDFSPSHICADCAENAAAEAQVDDFYDPDEYDDDDGWDIYPDEDDYFTPPAEYDLPL